MSIAPYRNRHSSVCPECSIHTRVFLRCVVSSLVFLAASCSPSALESPPSPRTAPCVIEPESAPVPKCVLSADSINFGEVFACDKNERTIRVSNQGSAPLTLSAVGSSCGCTEAEIDLPEILPGEEADLRISLALSDYPKDEVDTRVTLETNDPLNKTQEIAVNAKITPEFTVQPAEIDFGKTKRGSRTTQTLTVTQTGRQPFALTSLETPQGVSFSIRQDSPTANPLQYTVELAFEPDETVSALESQAVLLTDVPRMARFPVRVKAQVVGIECTLKPGVLVFGPSAPGSQTAPVKLTSSNPVKVLSIESPDPSLEPVTTSVEAVTQHDICIRITPGARLGNRSGKLLAKVQEGALVETITIPFFGTVSQ